MRTDRIRTIEDIDKALNSIERQLDRTEYDIQRDVDNLLDLHNLLLSGFKAVKSVFGNHSSE